jgi:hypothetical protein
MAIEIGEGKGINVRRPDAAELLKTRRGELNLDELIIRVIIIEDMTLSDKSDLPNSVE